ncbi:phosphoribosyl-ATP pyrophosphohydrolase [Anaerobacillus alkaliphilus]|uniref:Phosphoribosyl-ATP pyrophosphohydrolase n=1 Tax=Anaerobacillus alkaliphilus TaxID=1548597 RepID=A0A4Q0VXR5_9BACI|nr:nucleoside triphosphate pyrophosphohydrolase [Anaerobacillus alkaliphilus]RXJ04484.1 phosphoribosyl-ATP pyrophosphohydrolase [Anaerobacillus alkaliphilus]
MPTYNKLVRDLIPSIIENTGKNYHTRTLDTAEYKVELVKKLSEEMNEFLQATNDSEAIEELADMLEVIHALTHIHHSNPNQLEEIRKNKAVQRGGFEKQIFLIDVED